jgi:hypothetical protein
MGHAEDLAAFLADDPARCGKILHLQAVDEQSNVAPELRGHRSEVELDSLEVRELRDAYFQHPPSSMAPRLRAARNLP